MNILYLVIFIIWFIFFLLLLYIFIIKRLKYLTDKHIEYTKVEWLMTSYNSLKRIIFLLMIMQFVLSILIILPFL